MKTCLAALAALAVLSVSAAPVLALSGAEMLTSPATQTEIDRKSGRCPSGEPRVYKPGCGGV